MGGRRCVLPLLQEIADLGEELVGRAWRDKARYSVYAARMNDVVRAAAVIEQSGSFLLVQEGHAFAYGRWNWNQGKVEDGETPEVAAVREAKEETGYDITIVRKLGVVEHPFTGTKEIHVFLGCIVGGELAINEGEILQARWFSNDDLLQIREETPGPWVCDMIAAI